MQKFVVIIVVACPLFAIADWVEQRLTLEWRNWLTSYLLRAYFADRSFFKLKQQAGSLDNPDQVITFTACLVPLVEVMSLEGITAPFIVMFTPLAALHLLQPMPQCMLLCKPADAVKQQKGNLASAQSTGHN